MIEYGYEECVLGLVCVLYINSKKKLSRRDILMQLLDSFLKDDVYDDEEAFLYYLIDKWSGE